MDSYLQKLSKAFPVKKEKGSVTISMKRSNLINCIFYRHK